MFLGRVIGSVWATVKWPEVEGLKLLTVRPHHLSDLAGGDAAAGACHDLVVCGDVLGAGVGEDVVIAYGHAARVALSEALGPEEQPSIPVDAAVVAIVDQMDVDAEALAAAVERGDKRTS
jgi:microcompartment protein CcmK/EutM